MRVVTAQQMQWLDQQSIDRVGIAAGVLMENAGRAVGQRLCETLNIDHSDTVWVVVGPGNNGGDGVVVARYLVQSGFAPQVFRIASPSSAAKGALATQLNIWQQSGGSYRSIVTTEELHELSMEAEQIQQGTNRLIVVDALFGTGSSRALEGIYADVVSWMNREATVLVSIDLPSGIEATTGQRLAVACEADHTMTLGLPKRGLFDGAGAHCAGLIDVVDIGIPRSLVDQLQGPACALIDPVSFADSFGPRAPQSHKGSYGHLVVIAGSDEKSGAGILTARAGLRSGAGLVTLALPESSHALIKPSLVEIMSLKLPESPGNRGALGNEAVSVLQEVIDGFQAIAVGPGLIAHEGLGELIAWLLSEVDHPLVLDAESLNVMAQSLELFRQLCRERRGHPCIITPHPGEMARLCETTSAEIQAHRFHYTTSFAKEFNLIVVLKGWRTLIAFPDGRCFINPTGNPGMSSAGMGDVLTGILGGFIAQGIDLEQAVPAAIYYHGLCGDRIRQQHGERGMIASDIIERLPRVVNGVDEANQAHQHAQG